MKDPFKSRKAEVLKSILSIPVRGRNILLAKILGVHETTVSLIAHGKKPISARTMLILESYFGTIEGNRFR